VDQSSPDYVSRHGRDRSLQRHFPIVDNLFRPGDICDRSAKLSKIAPKKHVFRSPNFWGGTPNFGPSLWNCTHFRSCGKFLRDRPRNHGDLALKKKRKKRNKQQQNIRAAFVLSQRAALNRLNAACWQRVPWYDDCYRWNDCSQDVVTTSTTMLQFSRF